MNVLQSSQSSQPQVVTHSFIPAQLRAEAKADGLPQPGSAYASRGIQAPVHSRTEQILSRQDLQEFGSLKCLKGERSLLKTAFSATVLFIWRCVVTWVGVE